MLLDEDHRRAPGIHQVRNETSACYFWHVASSKLPGGLAELASLGCIESVVLLAVLEWTFAHLVRVDSDPERGCDTGEGEFRTAKGVVVSVRLNSIAAHECKECVLSGSDLRKIAVAIQPCVQGFIRNRGWVLAKLLEVGVTRLRKLLSRTHGGGGLGALNNLTECWQ